jgi:hypothetical protein
MYIEKTVLKTFSKKLVSTLETLKCYDSHEKRYTINLPFGKAICMQTDEENDWHTDCAYLNFQTIKWARIIYLTEGAPIQFGHWDWKCKQGIVAGPYGGWPIPETVCREIKIYPGLIIDFPAFYLHRNPPHRMKENRWAIVSFSHSNKLKSLSLYKDYFGKDYSGFEEA